MALYNITTIRNAFGFTETEVFTDDMLNFAMDAASSHLYQSLGAVNFDAFEAGNETTQPFKSFSLAHAHLTAFYLYRNNVGRITESGIVKSEQDNAAAASGGSVTNAFFSPDEVESKAQQHMKSAENLMSIFGDLKKPISEFTVSAKDTLMSDCGDTSNFSEGYV